MLFELVSSAVVGGFVSGTYLHRMGHGLSGNDTQKIVRIARNAGLVAKDGTEIRIHRRSPQDNYVEYAFQLPHGLSSSQFQDKLDRFQDGLNAKRSVLDISLADFRKFNWKGNVAAQIKALLEKKKKIRKQVEIEFDGMMIFRVYNEGITEKFEFNDEQIKSLKNWEVPVGIGRREYVVHDFDKIAHMIAAGTTDFGKSNWLKLVVTVLIKRKPDDVTFTLIDLKRGLSFSRFKNAKQVEAVAKNPDEALEALKTVQERMDAQMNFLEANGFEDVKEAKITKRHFVIIDEAADIAEHEECQEIITNIAREGRAAGFRLIYATQYPTRETVRSQVKRNCIGRLCFILDTATASNVVIDQDGAEKLPVIKGRALYKDGVRVKEIQTPLIKNSYIDDAIKPHINIRARKEDDLHASDHREGTTPRKHSLIVEEVGIYDEKPNTKTSSPGRRSKRK